MSDSRGILVALDDSLVAAGLVALLTQVSRVDLVTADLTTFTEALACLQPTIAFVGASLGGVSLVSRMGQLTGRFSATRVVVCLREDDPAIEDVVRLSGAAAVCNYRTKGEAIVAQTSALLAGQAWQAAVELGEGERASEDDGLYPGEPLSVLQWRLVELFAKGITTAAAAERLGRSAKVLEYHRREIREKLGVPSAQTIPWERVRRYPQNN
jgi:DNA-binding NarL/FixJ family response regulator